MYLEHKSWPSVSLVLW